MKNFFLKVLATVMAAAIVGNVTALWNFSARLARIETVLAIKYGQTTENQIVKK